MEPKKTLCSHFYIFVYNIIYLLRHIICHIIILILFINLRHCPGPVHVHQSYVRAHLCLFPRLPFCPPLSGCRSGRCRQTVRYPPVAVFIYHYRGNLGHCWWRWRQPQKSLTAKLLASGVRAIVGPVTCHLHPLTDY